MACPSPVATNGLVVCANTWPAPPHARTTARARVTVRLTLPVEGEGAHAPPGVQEQVDDELVLVKFHPGAGG